MAETTTPPTSSKRIAILTSGTRGDIQPCVNLAKGLIAAGHRVVIVTNEVYRDFVTANGQIEFRGLQGDPQFLMKSKDAQKALVEGDLARLIALVKPIGKALFEGATPYLADHCRDAELLIATPMCYTYAATISELLSIPMCLLSLAPTCPTNDFPMNFLADVTPPNMTNYESYTTMYQNNWTGSKEETNAWRESLGLAPCVHPIGPWGQIFDQKVPVINPISKFVIPQASDWPEEYIAMTGGLIADSIGEALSPEIEEFLNAGEAPIFMSLGSMPTPDPLHLINVAKAITQRTGQRAILSAGWSELNDVMDDLRAHNILVIKEAPYTLLFPRCKCLIHHCGAGTTHSAIYSGTPQVTVPVFLDQPFWAKRMEKLGVSTTPIVFREMNADNVSEAVAKVCSPDSSYAAKAKELAAKIHEEEKTGVDRAVDVINKWFAACRFKIIENKAE